VYQYEVLIRDLYTSRVEMPLAAFRGHAEEPCISLLLTAKSHQDGNNSMYRMSAVVV